MMRIRFPVRRLAPARDDDASAIQWAVWPDRDGSGQVHDSSDRAKHARAVIHEADELADGGLLPQIDDTTQRGMMISFRPNLRKEDAAFEMIDDGLPTLGGPPFDGDVVLSSSGKNPIRHIGPNDLCNLRRPCLFNGMEMDVALKQSRADLHAELIRKILGEAVDAVVRCAIALAEQRIVALDDAAFILADRCDVGIVQPEVVERCPQIGEVAPRIRHVQFADSGGEKRDVAKGIPAAEDQFFPHCVGMRDEDERLFIPWRAGFRRLPNGNSGVHGCNGYPFNPRNNGANLCRLNEVRTRERAGTAT